MKENLLAGCPDKVLVTIDTPNSPILIFAVWRHFQYVSRFRLCHDLLPGSIPLKCLFRRANKEQHSERGNLFSCPPNEVKEIPAARAAPLGNLYITMAKLCQGKSCVNQVRLDFLSDRVAASAPK